MLVNGGDKKVNHVCLCLYATFRHRKGMSRKNIHQKNKHFFVCFNNDMGLSLDDETKDYVDRNTGGQVNSLHDVTQLG